jgi:hypothetical protein
MKRLCIFLLIISSGSLSAMDNDGVAIKPELFNDLCNEHQSSMQLLKANYDTTKEIYWELKLSTRMFTTNGTSGSLETARILVEQITKNTELILRFLFKYKLPIMTVNFLYQYLLDYNQMNRSLFSHLGQ